MPHVKETNSSGTTAGYNPDSKNGVGSGIPIVPPIILPAPLPFIAINGCGSCPPSVLAILEKKLTPIYLALTAAQQLVDSLNALADFVTNLVLDDITIATLSVPTIPSLDITEMLSYFTCPLTPMAIMWSYLDAQSGDDIDYKTLMTNMDPRMALEEMKKMLLAQLESAKRNYLNLLVNCPSQKIIIMIKALVDAWRRLEIDPVKIAKAILTVAYAKAVCGSSYPNTIFWKLEQLFASGVVLAGVPAKLDSRIATVVTRMISADLTFKTIARQLLAPTSIPTLPSIPFDISSL